MQNVDINFSDIDSVLDQTECIYNIDFTGGEPLLNLRAIQYVLWGLYKRGIPVLSMTMVSNGSIYSDEVVETIKRYADLIKTSWRFVEQPDYEANIRNQTNVEFTEDDISKALQVIEIARERTHHIRIGISFDSYHKCKSAQANYNKYKKALEGYAYVEKKTTGNKTYKVGRAKNLDGIDIYANAPIFKAQSVEYKSKDHDPGTPCSSKIKLAHEDQVWVLCDVYVSARGNIVSGWVSGFLPYEAEDAVIICHAKDDIFKGICKYNERRFDCMKANELHGMIKYTEQEKQFIKNNVILPAAEKEYEKINPFYLFSSPQEKQAVLAKIWEQYDKSYLDGPKFVFDGES